MKVDPEILGSPDSVLLGGVSLLTLALRTGDEGVIRQVLEYDNDIDKIIPVSVAMFRDLRSLFMGCVMQGCP